MADSPSYAAHSRAAPVGGRCTRTSCEWRGRRRVMSRADRSSAGRTSGSSRPRGKLAPTAAPATIATAPLRGGRIHERIKLGSRGQTRRSPGADGGSSEYSRSTEHACRAPSHSSSKFSNEISMIPWFRAPASDPTEASHENRPARPRELTLTGTSRFNPTCALSVSEEQAKLGVIAREGAAGVRRMVGQTRQ